MAGQNGQRLKNGLNGGSENLSEPGRGGIEMIDDTIGNAMTMQPGEGGKLGRIDQYELERELGGGGFGTVFLAKDTVAGIEVAVKGLPPFVKNNREEVENIRDNFALVSRLTHTNIAKALVLHPSKDVFYSSEDVRQKLRVLSGDTLMVMEYAPGVTLSKWRKQFPQGKVPFDTALSIVRQIASALDYAHGQKILHRDIKPANVMVETRDGDRLVARVLDFGLAAEIRSSMGRVSREIHDTSGTRPYMAPEQWDGARQGPATDQYSLAVLFHELVTGSVPFASIFDTGDPVVMMNVVGNKPFKASNEFPKSVRRALEKALSKKPAERFANCCDFVDTLEGKATISRSGAVRREKGGSWKLLLVFALLVALGGGGAWWLAETRNELPRPDTQTPPLPPPRPSVTESDVTEIRVEAEVQTERLKRINDSNGFRARKDFLADKLTGAVAYGKAEKWDKAAVAYTNYVDACLDLLKLDGERSGAVSDSVKAESAKQDAEDSGAKQYALVRWQSATGLFEEGQELMSQMRFADARQRFVSAGNQFSQCAKEAREERARLEKPAAVKDKGETNLVRERQVPQPPTLTVVAKLDGVEVPGAILETMTAKHTLPYKWTDSRLFKGRSLGPYLVRYPKGNKEYYGSFCVTVDWTGPHEEVVILKPEWPNNIKTQPKGIGGLGVMGY